MKPPNSLTISGDSHVIEPVDLWWKAMGAKYGDRTPRTVGEHNGKPGRYFYDGRNTNEYGSLEESRTERMGQFSRATNVPAERVRFQEAAGLAAEVLNPSLTMGVMAARDPEIAQVSTQVYNDWAAEFQSYDPKRLIGVAAVPTHDPVWASRELARLAKAGFRAAMINCQPPLGCPPYRDAVYDPLWGVAQDAGIPLILHIVTGRAPDPFLEGPAPDGSTASRMLGLFMYEIMDVLANEFIFGQILDRFPKLKVLCGEYEISWIPSFMFRIDQMQNEMAAPLGLPKLKSKASDYMRTRVWHGMIDDEFGIATLPIVGVDQVMWGSDYPHVRSIGVDAQPMLAKMFKDVKGADRAKVVGGTAAKLFNLD